MEIFGQFFQAKVRIQYLRAREKKTDEKWKKNQSLSYAISAPKFPNCVLLRIDFAETLQRGSLDQNNQTYQNSFSNFVLLPVLWATSG